MKICNVISDMLFHPTATMDAIKAIMLEYGSNSKDSIIELTNTERKQIGLPSQDQVLEVPFGMIDSVEFSSFNETYDLHFYAFVSTCYLSHKAPGVLKHEKDLLEQFTLANDHFRLHASINASLYLFLPGKCGCCFSLNLSEGTRRFGGAYHFFLLGIQENRKLPVRITRVHVLNEDWINKQCKLFRSPYKRLSLAWKAMRGKDASVFSFRWVFLPLFKKCLKHQEFVKSHIPLILRILQGSASIEDYKSLYKNLVLSGYLDFTLGKVR